MNRGREGPALFLGPFERILQTDDYIAYERDIGGPKMVHAACWAHSRTRFVDAVKLNRQDAASIRAVQLMDELFAIDREAREAQMDHAGASSAAPGESSASAGSDPRTYPGDQQDGVARECGRQSVPLHAGAVEEADAFPRIPATGAQ